MTLCPTTGTGRTGPRHHCTGARLQGWHTELPFQPQITLLAPSPPSFDSNFAVFFPQSTARYSSHAQQHECPTQESDPHPQGWGPAPALPLPTTQHLKTPSQSQADATGCERSQRIVLLPAGPCPIDSPMHWLSLNHFHPKRGRVTDSSPGDRAEPGE